MSTNLSPEVTQLITKELALGRYKNEQEVLTEAVQLLSQRNALRDEIAAGSRQLASGEYTDYNSESLRQRFNDLKAGKSGTYDAEVIAIQEGIDDMEARRDRL